MTVDIQPTVATAVIGLAAFELWKAYENTAPSLSECRETDYGDVDKFYNVKQRLLDADLSVGTIALVIGVTYAVLTRNMTVLVLMTVMLGVLSLWRHQVLNAAAL